MMKKMSSIARVLRAYAFSEADKQHLTDLLAKSYLLAKTQAYNRAVSRTKHVVTIRKPWQPSESDVEKAQQWASKQVDSIAETYETLLQHAIEQLPEQPHEAIGDVIGKVKDVVDKIGDWFKGFLPWKTQQVANETWGSGDNDGTEQFIEDVQGDGVEGKTSSIKITVLPGTSSNDTCAAYAGNTYSLSDEVPAFPIHPNCPHRKIVTIFDEPVESAENESVRKATLSESSGTISLFLDIDGVFNISDAGLPLEQIGNSRFYQWTHPIPQARAVLQTLDQHKDLGPIWCSHWGKQSNYWNYWAGVHRWLVCFPLKGVGEMVDSKPYAIQQYLDLSDKRGGVWVQDGFTDEEQVWAEKLGLRLIDATQEPVRSLLLSDEPGAVQELIDIFAGSEVVV